MLKRFLQQRGMRKLFRDRFAVASLVVIGLFTLFGALVLTFGLISTDETVERIGPGNIPGFGMEQEPEKRLQNAEFYLETIADALESRDPATELAAIRFAELLPVSEDPAVLTPIVERGWKHYDTATAVADIGSDASALAGLEALEATVAELFPPPESGVYELRLMLGTDRQGRSILFRALYAIKVAIQIGVVSSFVAVLMGTLMGAAAGYFGGVVDGLVTWLFSTFSSIPWIVLLLVLATMFTGSAYDGTLIPVYASFCLTFWISPCRVVRGEVLKLKELEYVQAAKAVGFGRMHILLRHIVPNTAHLMFINFSLLFIGAIKAEVILSFLGLGVKNEPSWGMMINHSRQEVLNGFFWQIGGATFFMVVLVLAFNVLSDALQDAFDPKHVG